MSGHYHAYQICLQHNLSCKKGGFVSLRHNHLRNIKANLIEKEKMLRNTERLQSLIIDLATNKIRLNKINQEKGASTRLLTLPLKEERYSLSKQEF